MVDKIVIIGATTKSVTSSATGVGLILVPISAGIDCALWLGNKVLHKIILNKYTKIEKTISNRSTNN